MGTDYKLINTTIKDYTTKSNLIDASNNRIVNDFRKGFDEALQELFNDPNNLSQYHNRIFVRTIRGIKLTDNLLEDIRNSLRRDFGFADSDIKQITLSSDDNPCLMVDFSLFNRPEN